MFVRLKRPMRARAGWFVALLYLLCVAAPGAALALGDAASCMVMQAGAAAAHSHVDSSHQHHSVQASGHSGQHADAGDIEREHNSHGKHGHESSLPGSCCAMLCVSAIAADLPTVVTPTQPISLCVLGNFQHLPGEAPPLLYRPPIA